MRALPWVLIAGYGVAPLVIGIWLTVRCQERWGQKCSWVVAAAYALGGVLLWFCVSRVQQVFRKLAKEESLVLAINPIVWIIVLGVLGAAVWWKDKVWRWRHANVTCVIVLFLLVWSVLAAMLHSLLSGRDSVVS